MPKMSSSDLIRLAEAGLVEARTLTSLLGDALRGLDVGLAGWPEQTPGANPDSSRPPGVLDVQGSEFPPAVDGAGHVFGHASTAKTTLTERAALTSDQARADMAALEAAVRAAEVAMRRASLIALRWGRPMLDGKSVAERLAAIDRDIWCVNCIRHGHRSPRHETFDVCEFCKTFAKDYGERPPKDVLDLRAAKGRIYVSDVQRILTRIRAERKAAEALRKRQQREAKKAAKAGADVPAG